MVHPRWGVVILRIGRLVTVSFTRRILAPSKVVSKFGLGHEYTSFYNVHLKSRHLTIIKVSQTIVQECMKHKTVSLHIGIATAPLLCGVRVRLAAGTSILELTWR